MDEKRKELYNRVARTAYDRAMDEALPLELRQWYAGLALAYDRKANG